VASASRAPADGMAMVDVAVETGESTIACFMERAESLQQLIASTFPDKALDDIERDFAGMLMDGATPKAGANVSVSKLQALVRTHAALATSDFRKAEMWVHLKQPAISDGNNFGVDVQNYVLEQLKAMREAISAMIVSVSDYHWQRGTGLEKLPMESKESSTSESTDVDGDKTVKKSSKSTKSSTKSPALEDYVAYVAALDVKAYHAAYCMLTDIQNSYIKAHMLFIKNQKRLSDPRGDGASGDRGNVMSMF